LHPEELVELAGFFHAGKIPKPEAGSQNLGDADKIAL
jgi:hypothetical protein